MSIFERLKKIFRYPRLSRVAVKDFERSSVQISTETKETSIPEPFKPTPDDEACAKLWKVYVDQATDYDESLLKEWKADMEALLIFSALYSASLTAFIVESYKTLQNDPAQNTVDLLIQVSRQLNGTTEFKPLPPFEPPASAVVCNMMWFLALALALACSLLATFVQQWTRDFIHKTTLRPSPVRRARIFAYLYFGLQEFGMPTFVDVIPILLHISLFLFFAGLVLFLFPINQALTYVMTAVLVIFTTTYLVLTFLPLFHLDSPYRTPLSGLLWRFRKAPGNFLAQFFSWQQQTLTEAMLEQSVQKNAQREERDKKAIAHTVKSLTDDTELLPFIEAIPDALYDQSQEDGVRSANVALLLPLILSAEPETNVVLRIAQFASKSGSWTGDFRTRNLLACSQALSAIACVSLDLPASEFSKHHISLHPQWRRTVLSSLQAVGASSLSNDIWLALTAIGVGCLYGVIHESHESFITSDGFAALETCESLFEAVSLYVDNLFPFSDPSCLNTLLKIFRKEKPSSHKTSEIKNKFAKLKGSEIWHFIRLYILHDYLVRSQHLEQLPRGFEGICNTIYPSSKTPLPINQSDRDLYDLLNTSSSLLALKKRVDDKGVLDNNTDMLLRQNLKLFLSTTIPLCTYDEAWECRQFVLWYLYRRYETCPPDYTWRYLDALDLDRILLCTFQHIQEPPNDTEQYNVCLKVAFILMCTFNLRWLQNSDFFSNLFHALNNNSLYIPFNMSDIDLSRVIFIKILPERQFSTAAQTKSIITEQAKTVISIEGGHIWHLIRIGILYRYLLEFSGNAHDSNFELMCNIVYPHSGPSSSFDSQDLSCFLGTGGLLLALEKHVLKTNVLDDSTDALLRQYLKVFFSTSKPLCSHGEEQKCQQTVLWYLHRRYEECSSYNNVWRKFWREDIERVGRCVLEQVEDPQGDSDQSTMCLKVTVMLMCTSHFRWMLYQGNFFQKLSHILHDDSKGIALKRSKGYVSFKNLLDLVVCTYPPVTPYINPTPKISVEQVCNDLAPSYHLPQSLYGDNSDSELLRNNLTIAIISQHISFSLESGTSLYTAGFLEELYLWDWISTNIHEEIQVIFAESIAKLVKTIPSRELKAESIELTLLKVMAFFPHWPRFSDVSWTWQWITDQQSARILFDALSQYHEPDGDEIPDVDGRFRYIGQWGRERLLMHCQEKLLESSSQNSEDVNYTGSGRMSRVSFDICGLE